MGRREEVKFVLTDWQRSFLISAVAEKVTAQNQKWDEEVKAGRMRRSERIAGLVEMNEVLHQAENLARP